MHWLIIFILLISSPVYAAGTYWVDDDGAAAWVACTGATPLSGASACPLATANSSADAGDTVYLRAGTYSDGTIQPANTGTGAGAKITFSAYNSETVILDDTGETVGAPYDYGILIDAKNYIVVTGITVRNQEYLVLLNNGASYNEISHCTIYNGANTGNSGLMIRDDSGLVGSQHNWIHHNTIYGAGYVSVTCNDESNLMKLGMALNEALSGNNTIENNVLYHGGHHVLETHTKNNVIRENTFYNDCWMAGVEACDKVACANSLYGNRNIQIYYSTATDDMFNLIEGNRIGHAGYPPDDQVGENISITAAKNIFRYNFSYAAYGDGLYMKDGAHSSDNRIYNNTFYYNGVGPSWEATRPNMVYRRNGLTFTNLSAGNVVVNNLFYGNIDTDMRCIGAGCAPEDLNTIGSNWLNATGNPSFQNPDVSDPTSLTLPNLQLQPESLAKDGGTYLTTVHADDTSSGTSLILSDNLYFQAGSAAATLPMGSGLSSVAGDWILVGATVATAAATQITDIAAYSATKGTVTISPAISRNDGDYVWLYKKSDGVVVLHGSAPDYGAHEWYQTRPVSAGQGTTVSVGTGSTVTWGN